MNTYSITCSGCDNHTTVEMELTADELKLVKLLCEKMKATSTYGCMPTMSVEPVEPKKAGEDS